MKKLLFIAILAVLATTVQAQTSVRLIGSGGSFSTGSNPYTTSLDTVTNTGTKTYYCSIPNRWNNVTFQVNMKDITGDPSGVYVNIYNAVDTAGGGVYDTVPLFSDTMQNANTTVVREITGNPVNHYKIVVTGVGTHSSSYQAKVFIR